MRRFTLFIFALSFIVSFGKDIVVKYDGLPLAGANVTGYSVAMDSIQSWVTDSTGIVSVQDKRVANLVVTHPDMTSKLVKVNDDKVQEIEMGKAINLKEVKITASNREEFATHDSFKLTAKQMEPYTTFFQALNEIPNMTVTTGGGIFYEGSENIVLLLNGVRTSRQELSTISKDDIAKINVYSTPPARFIMQGVGCVVDVLTKSVTRGGNIGLDLRQAFYPVFGDNTLGFYYNHGRSKFGVNYNNENKHYNKLRRNSELIYEFRGQTYSKVKTGKDSEDDMDDNTIRLTYQNRLAGNYLYNLQVGGSFYRHDRNYNLDVNSNGNLFSANNLLNTSYDNLQIVNYFEKELGGKSEYGSLLGNENYQHFANKYHSAYKEYYPSQEDTPFEDHSNSYKTRFDVVYGELQYHMPEKKWGSLEVSVYGNYKHSQYYDSELPFYQKMECWGWQRSISR